MQAVLLDETLNELIGHRREISRTHGDAVGRAGRRGLFLNINQNYSHKLQHKDQPLLIKPHILEQR